MFEPPRRRSAATTIKGTGAADETPLPGKLVDDLQINLIGRKNIGREIYHQLLQAIQEGRLESGMRLPPTRELARRLKVARTTVAVAYDRLVGEGLLESRIGAGTFVKRGAAGCRPHRKGPDRKGRQSCGRGSWVSSGVAPVSNRRRARRANSSR